jgi:hypothetical protein
MRTLFLALALLTGAVAVGTYVMVEPAAAESYRCRNGNC